MKRLAIIIICTLIVLSGCSNSEKQMDKKQTGWRINSYYDMTDNAINGMFFTGLEPNDEKEPLKILDFGSMELTAFCNKPNCSHNDKSICTALGKNNHPFIYNNKLYYFKDSDIYQDGEQFKKDTTLWQLDFEGNKEKQVAEFKEMTFEYYDRLLISGEKIYMCMKKQHYDNDYKQMEGYSYLMSVNLLNGVVNNYGELSNGYNFGASVLGMWNDKVICVSLKSTDDRPYMEKVQEYKEKNNLTDKQAMEGFENKIEYISTCFELDFNNKNVMESSLPIPMIITNNYYFFKDGDSLKYYDLEGNGKEVPLYSIKEPKEIIDLHECAYIITQTQNFIFDYDKKQLKELSKIGENESPVSAYNGNIIIKKTNEDGSISFDKKKLIELEE